ncbi:hypothetical protein ACMXYO_02930 [Neptuniibacter sp. QD37_6]|uniref:hypothetical protein n=1 Tax=Neptuniibacter sp. QD37_6 TaxID=3398210 RepID=UPI0039F46CF2
MCGIFGGISTQSLDVDKIRELGMYALERGQDSSGLVEADRTGHVCVTKAPFSLGRLFKEHKISDVCLLAGHSRLATNSIEDNQPVVKDGIILIHNGIICNFVELYAELDIVPQTQVDSEIILDLYLDGIQSGLDIELSGKRVLERCEGVVSAVLFDTIRGKIVFISNNGSFYVLESEGGFSFSSESFPIESVFGETPDQHFGIKVLDFAFSGGLDLSEIKTAHNREHYLPKFEYIKSEDSLLEYKKHELQRCTKCILPSTMPFIHFDDEGVCNYCNNYKISNSPRKKDELYRLIEPYRRSGKRDCIVPFSGGRDSSFGLHLICRELGLNPIAYTYDWGMVTDLGRRNISRMCAELGVENIVIAADIGIKRRNIRKNLVAWLKNPHLGMMSLLTAGDKHFFRHVETVKRQTGISLNLWGVNPMEVTHFKTGFLGIPPAFENDKVYSSGLQKQLDYQRRRFAQFLKNPSYFNSSLKDTLSGEYWRSIHKKTDYFHIFDYYQWVEEEVDSTLREYNWEFAADLDSSWRIGDATAAFYNYVYYTMAGFTEHDTFRSNEIREGLRTREEALRLVNLENAPRYESIKWYLDALNIDFEEAIKRVNSAEKVGGLV